MATGSLMMGTLKGKLGETVALRRSGKQVLRAYVRDVKNPNSQKQQVQRMVQSTVAQAYSAMKKICDHSFEGVQVGQKSMSYFMSKNMDKLRASIKADTDGTLTGADADFVRKGVNLPVLNNYIVAKGTLPEIRLNDGDGDWGSEFNPFVSIGLAEALDSNANKAIDAFVRQNGANLGDWFTFLFMFNELENIVNGQKVYRFGFVRFTVVSTSDNGETILALKPSLTNNGVVEVSVNAGIGMITDQETSTNYLVLNLNTFFSSLTNEGDSVIPVSYAVIHSRQNVGGSWQRSNAEFVIRDNITALNITWPDDFFAELATYAGSAEAKGKGDYVLNGGQ